MSPPEPRQMEQEIKKPKRQQEPTREEMIQFIRAGVEVCPATIEDVKAFIQNKYGNSPWVNHLLSRVLFDYEKESNGNVFGRYNSNANMFLIPIYSFSWRQIEISAYGQGVQMEYSFLREHNYTKYYSFSSNNTLVEADDFSQAPERLIKTMYNIMRQWETELGRKERKTQVMEAIDHEFGHAILDYLKEKQGADIFGISYRNVERYVVERMHNHNVLTTLEDIMVTYLIDPNFRYASGVPDKIATFKEKFFREPEDPVKIHPDGPALIAEIAKIEPDYLIHIIEIRSNTGDINAVTNEEWAQFKGILTEEEISELKKLKNINDMHCRYGLWVKNEGGSFFISYDKSRHGLTEKYGLKPEQYLRLLEVNSQLYIRDVLVGECFSRLLDSLTDGNLRNDGLRIGITPADLEFFRQFKFEGEPMFDKFIEDIEKEMRQVKPKKLK